MTGGPLRRVRVEGDLFHGRVPGDAFYVGRAAPGLPASRYANPFRLKRGIARGHPLRPYLDAAVTEITVIAAESLAGSHHDVIHPITPVIAVTAFALWFGNQPALAAFAEDELPGRDLCCWCPLPPEGEPDWCHAAWLMRRFNGGSILAPPAAPLAGAGE